VSQKTRADRLRWIIFDHLRHRSQAEYARSIGMRPQQLSRYLTDDSRSMAQEVALRIANGAGVSVSWLLEGRGSPLREPKTGTVLDTLRGIGRVEEVLESIPDRVLISAAYECAVGRNWPLPHVAAIDAARNRVLRSATE